MRCGLKLLGHHEKVLDYLLITLESIDDNESDRVRVPTSVEVRKSLSLELVKANSPSVIDFGKLHPLLHPLLHPCLSIIAMACSKC